MADYHNISEENYIGTILPDVFLDNVKLESTGGYIPSSRNPHIMSEREASLRRRSGGAYRQSRGVGQEEEFTDRSLSVTVQAMLKDSFSRDILNSWFFDQGFLKYINVAIICSTSENITNLFLSRELDASFRGALFYPQAMNTQDEDGQFQNLLKSKVRLLFGQVPVNHPLRDQISAALLDVDENLLAQLVKIEHEIDSDRSLVPYSHLDDKGRQIFNLNFSRKFDLGETVRNLSPEHLTVFAYTWFDLNRFVEEKISGDVIFNFAEINNGALGSLKASSVIQNSQLVQTGVVLRNTNTGEIYTGPYHVEPNGQYVASGVTPRFVLRAEVVPNNAIQDFRNFEEFRARVTDLTTFEKSYFPTINKFFKNYVKQNIHNLETLDYFSDISISRNFKGESRFVFSANFEKMFKDNTKYPRLLEKVLYVHGRRYVKNYFRINSFKIVRKRVDELKKVKFRNTLEDKPTIVPFDGGLYDKSIGIGTAEDITKYDVPHIIVATEEDRQTGKFKSITAARPRVERQGGRIRELNLRANPNGFVRSFTVSDLSMSDIGRGTYQYGVEIEIIDSLSFYLHEKLGELLKARNELNKYYVRANQPTGRFAGGNISFKDPHIETTFLDSELFPTTLQYDSKKSFDVRANRFTESFINREENRYSDLGPQPGEQPWVIVGNVIERTLLCFMSQNELLAIYVPRFFETLCSPRTGTIDGIEATINLMDELAQNISRIIGTEISQKKSLRDNSEGDVVHPMTGDVGAPQLSSADPQRNVFKITHYFANDVFDASFPRDTGYEYLLPRGQTRDEARANNGIPGLRAVTTGMFDSRRRSEIGKYFPSEEVDVQVNGDLERSLTEALGFIVPNLSVSSDSHFSFLSPSKISVHNGSRLDLLERLPNVQNNDHYNYDRYALLASEIANLKSPAGQLFSTMVNRSVGTASSKAVIRDNLLEVLADKGCTIDEDVPKEILEFEERQTSNRSGQSARETYGENHPIVDQIENENIAETLQQRRVYKSMIQGVHTTLDTDVFNPGLIFLKLFLNMAMDDENLERRVSSLRRTKSLKYSISNFNVLSVDSVLARPRFHRIEDASMADLVRELPPQIKALFLASLETIPRTKRGGTLVPGDNPYVGFSTFSFNEDVLQDPIKSLVYILNFFNLVRIEAFVGFETKLQDIPVEEAGLGALRPGDRPATRQRPTLMMKKPIWVPLDSRMFLEIESRGKELLCRMTKYENPFFGVEPLAGLELPIFDEYFILRPGRTPPTETGDSPPQPPTDSGRSSNSPEEAPPRALPPERSSLPRVSSEYVSTDPRDVQVRVGSVNRRLGTTPGTESMSTPARTQTSTARTSRRTRTRRRRSTPAGRRTPTTQTTTRRMTSTRRRVTRRRGY